MLASIVIDGQKLKDAREAKGQSIAEVATSLTLSREQIKYIEEGGDKPFYTPAHKLLAVRKYANAMGLPYDEVVIGEGADLTLAAPEEAPPSMHVHVHSQPEVANELRLAAVMRNAEIRRQILIAGVIICILLGLYAKVRGSDEDADAVQQQDADAIGMAVYESKTEPTVLAATPAKPPAVQLTQAAPVALTTTVSEASDDDANCSQEQAGTELKNWSPAYQRKSDSRLYVISPHGGSLCIADAAGNAKHISLKPMVGQTIPGKPPYTVRSSHLAQIEMYLQGLRVKVPSATNAMRLLPTNKTSPEASDPTRTLSSEL